jgi:hypothetical protein
MVLFLESQHRPGEWSEAEDSKLKDSAQRHGGRNGDEIATLIPGRGEGSVGAAGVMS